MASYRHICALETRTLALLLKHQGPTLRDFSITRYLEPQNISSLLVRGLQYLAITDLNTEQECEWPSRLIAYNRNALRHLTLGGMGTLAQYPIKNRPSHRGLPTLFAETAKGESSAFERDM